MSPHSTNATVLLTGASRGVAEHGDEVSATYLTLAAKATAERQERTRRSCSGAGAEQLSNGNERRRAPKPKPVGIARIHAHVAPVVWSQRRVRKATFSV